MSDDTLYFVRRRFVLAVRIWLMFPAWPATTCWRMAGRIQDVALEAVAEERADEQAFAGTLADIYALPETRQ